MLLLSQILAMVVFVGVSYVAYTRGAQAREDEQTHSQWNAIQGALLGLLGLLLGFSASMAEARLSARRELILTEANAIGTAYLRADLLEDRASAERYRRALRDYVDERLAFYDAGSDSAAEDRASQRATEIQAEVWALVVANASSSRAPDIAALVVESANAVIDAEGARHASLRAHLPASLLWLVVVVAIAAIGASSYAWGHTGKRSLVAVWVLPILIGLAFSVILDLDSPRVGLVRSGDAPMRRLAASIHAD
jgi:hypothetical protein